MTVDFFFFEHLFLKNNLALKKFMDLNLTHYQVQNNWIRQSTGRFGSVFIKKK